MGLVITRWSCVNGRSVWQILSFPSRTTGVDNRLLVAWPPVHDKMLSKGGRLKRRRCLLKCDFRFWAKQIVRRVNPYLSDTYDYHLIIALVYRSLSTLQPTLVSGTQCLSVSQSWRWCRVILRLGTQSFDGHTPLLWTYNNSSPPFIYCVLICCICRESDKRNQL